MTTAFPAALDALTNPTATQLQSAGTRTHSQQHSDLNDALESVQAKVGINNSTDPNSLDYKVRVTPYTPSGTGAISQAVQDEIRRTIRPEHFGALGDGVHDDTTAIQLAVTAAGQGGRVTFAPGKTYLISDTLTPVNANFVEFYSAGGHLDRAAKIQAAGSMNKPMLSSVGGWKFRLHGMALVGSSTTGTPLTSQACVSVDTVNDIAITNCFLSGAHDLIKINGVCFYVDIDAVRFGSCTNSWLYATCGIANGVDMRITRCRGNTTQAAPYGFYFSGLGSLIMADNQFSPSHCTTAGVMVDTMASLAGPSFISNTVFELGAAGVPAVYLKGDATYACKQFHFSNSYLFGDASLRLGYATKIHLDNCYLTGSGDGASGRNAISVDNLATEIYVNNVAFEVTNIPIVTAAGATALSFYIENPRYSGSQIFCELSNLTTAANLLAFACNGGNVGTNANPVKLPGELDRLAYINCFGENYGPIRPQVYVGTFAATGIVNIPHGIGTGNKRVVGVQAWTRGGSGQMLPLTVNYVDAANVQINNATSTAVYRMVVWFMNVADANWP